FDAFLRGDREQSKRLVRTALTRYRKLVQKIRAARPLRTDEEPRRIVSDAERANVLIRDGLALIQRGLVRGSKPMIVKGVNEVTSGQRRREALYQRLAVIALRYA